MLKFHVLLMTCTNSTKTKITFVISLHLKKMRENKTDLSGADVFKIM